MARFLSYVLIFTFVTIAQSRAETRAGLAGWESEEANSALWQNYCIGNPVGADIPRFNYDSSSDITKGALASLSKVAAKSYFLYVEIEELYELRERGSKKGDKKPLIKPKYELPEGISLEANAFLVYLCGEFRDRATMIEAKLKWISNLYKLPVTEGSSEYDFDKSPWAQLTAQTYDGFLDFSRQLWFARKAETPDVDFGDFSVEGSVEGMSVCQMKYIFSKYILPQESFSDLEEYDADYEKFQKGSKRCSDADRSDYYTFRGDTNFKPNSPEGNAMIFRGRYMAASCKSPTKAKILKNGGELKNEDCESYYKRPFQSRWEAARAGLASWLFHDNQYESLFEDTGGTQITMHLSKDGSIPLNFSLDPSAPVSESWNKSLFMPEWVSLIEQKSTESVWNSLELGFNEIAKLGSGTPNYRWAYTRIKNAVDRHTDWYAMGYVDPLTGRKGNAAYSPFVASSYEMYESNNFTSCGITITCIPDEHDDRKHWMFVFRVKGDNWYKTQDLKAEKSVDLSRVWFDETSFGTTGLADSEHAWDRLGTAMEDEYDSIIYLHNITKSGEIIEDDLQQ